MPVHYSLLWIPEIQGEEFHGPIDGVRPIDYPENYEYLMELSKIPVHHSLLWIPEIQEEEFYGPIDGVRPIDYPETYGYLMELKCVMALENQLYQNIIDLRKICNSCYAIT
ncbi:hypothetical protein RF55_24800, partial [Lasius niger]